MRVKGKKVTIERHSEFRSSRLKAPLLEINNNSAERQKDLSQEDIQKQFEASPSVAKALKRRPVEASIALLYAGSQMILALKEDLLHQFKRSAS